MLSNELATGMCEDYHHAHEQGNEYQNYYVALHCRTQTHTDVALREGSIRNIVQAAKTASRTRSVLACNYHFLAYSHLD